MLSFGGTCSGTYCKTILSQGKSRIFGWRVIVSQIGVWIELTEGVVIITIPFMFASSRFTPSPTGLNTSSFWSTVAPSPSGLMQMQWTIGSTPTITGDGDVASFHWPDHLYLLDSQGDFQPLPASDPRTTRLSDLVDECFLCAPPITAVPASEPVRWRWPIGSHLKGRLPTWLLI